MTDEKLKYRIGAKIAECRKQAGLTQAGLAEKLNYSDKAVSKWERGDSIPDVLTLMQLAELFSIPVGELLTAPEDADDSPAVRPSQTPPKRKADKNVILALSSTLVWFLALLAFVVLSSFDAAQPYSCLPFFYAIPANAIVLLCLRSAWRDFSRNQILISAIVWGCLLSFYVTVRVIFHVRFWKVFLLGIPGQIAVFLWFRMFRKPKTEEVKNG